MTYPFNTVMTWLFSYHPSPARAMVDLDFVCTDQEGKLIRPNFVTEHFDWLLTKYGLKHIRFHDLRHSCASLLLANGVPMKQIQEWLGHSDFSTTANIYAHLDYASKLSSAQAMLEGLGYGNASA